MIFIAASMSLAFKSGILYSAIALICSFVTLPTLTEFGVAEPLLILAASFNLKVAGVVFKTKS